MDVLVQRYKTWFSKKVENILCTKGTEGKQFTNRFQTLQLCENLLGAYHHASVMYSLAREFEEERKNLNWVRKFTEDCDGWKLLFESVLYNTPVSEDDVITSLVSGEIDCEMALDLT